MPTKTAVQADTPMRPHSAHWGAFSAGWKDGVLVVRPHPADPDPNPLIDNYPAALHHRARVTQPMVRKGWLARGPGADAARGQDGFVPMAWDEVLDRLASELQRVKNEHGCEAIFGGSYGWSSAGRFHHAQSQVHRFLNTALGGYVRSVNSYSAGASGVILPHFIGSMDEGRPAQRHLGADRSAHRRGVGFRRHGAEELSRGQRRHQPSCGARRDARRSAARLPLRGGKPAAQRHARRVSGRMAGSDPPAPTPRLCWAWPTSWCKRACMTGTSSPGTATGGRSSRTTCWAAATAWRRRRNGAAHICGLPPQHIAELARSLAGKRVLVVVAHALQRSEHGEQPVWMGGVLAALLGQIGLPGGGFNYALGTLAHYGKRTNAVPSAALAQGSNGVKAFIPVARVADMLLNPGEPFDYNGQRLTYPHIRLAYWAGGNPFHHHQDLQRLSAAFRRLETFVVHEIAWTATARHADIVLPCTMTLEREDIGAAPTDPVMVAMHRIAEPHGMARDDYDIFCDLAERLGQRETFSEGRNTRQWLAAMYEKTRAGLASRGLEAPDFETFWGRGELTLPQQPDSGGILRAFRDDPDGAPLPTPSGKLQISSPQVAAFGYADCPGHPAWVGQSETPSAEHPLWLVSNQPASRLHSQLDFGGHSQSLKQHGREVCCMNPIDAAARGLRAGDIARLFNQRGACLAAVSISDEIMPGVMRLPTGAWYDPRVDAQGRALCVSGNPNVLTRDVGTSSLAQGCSGQLTVVQVERFDEALPPIRAFEPPAGS